MQNKTPSVICHGGGGLSLPGVDVDADGDEEEGDESEVDDGVDENGGAARVEVAELHYPPAPRDLE